MIDGAEIKLALAARMLDVALYLREGDEADAAVRLALVALTSEEFIEWIATHRRSEGMLEAFELLRAGAAGNQSSEGLAA